MRATLYHGTNSEFDSFSDEAPGTRDDSANNSALGIWFFTEERYTSSFGGRVIEAEVELGRAYGFPIEEFSQMHSRIERAAESDEEARAAWRAWRAELLCQGYNSVEIVEMDGRIGIRV